ncbi:MAG: hypothetical protein LUQ61_01925, partial [Methanoregulaceae archaeon]|nr:hypothetical protein [Methanoregulaceae archaeon]
SAPVALLLPATCGAACGACPVSGGCLVIPGAVALFAAAGHQSDLTGRIRRAMKAEPPPGDSTGSGDIREAG